MADETESALSGGLLVLLTLIVAVVIGALFIRSNKPSETVHVIEVPASSAPAATISSPPVVNVQTPAPTVNVQPAPDVNIQVPAPNVEVQQQPAAEQAPAEPEPAE